MKMKKKIRSSNIVREPIEIRDDLKDGDKGKDLSYLSEMPQMGGYEGVKAGTPENQDDRIKKEVNVTIGRKVWAIADGYIPSKSNGSEPEMTSHETASILNASDTDAHLDFTIYFSDKDPVGPYRVIVPAKRTRHVRFNDFNNPQPIPRDTDYACVIESDIPVVVQHTRLDSRQAENALLSTMAYPVS